MLDLAAVNRDMGFFRAVVAFRAGRDLDAVFYKVKGAELRLAVFLGISGSAQGGGNFLDVHLFAVVHGAGQSVDFGGIAEDRGAEALLDNAVVLDVEVAEKSADADGHDQEDDQCGANYGIAG